MLPLVYYRPVPNGEGMLDELRGCHRHETRQEHRDLMREAERVGKASPAETLDLVIFTTGIFASPKRQETAEGIERDLTVSYSSWAARVS